MVVSNLHSFGIRYTRKLLRKKVFFLNDYDQSIANKEIEGKQCTIAWYVDNNKLLHENQKVNDEILKIMSAHFGDLKITRGKKNTFLGTNFCFTDDKNLRLI